MSRDARRGRLSTLALLVGAAACGAPSPRARAPARDPAVFLASRARGTAAPAAPVRVKTEGDRSAVYDGALVALVHVARGERAAAAQVLEGLAAVQSEDGALPFSFGPEGPDPRAPYVRSGALAWVGYAAAAYLDAERGGPSRAVVVALAHRAAAYLLAHQVRAPSDPRDGLVTGGAGTYRYDEAGGRVREIYVPGDVGWASTEHNIDAYFFLRKLARVTEAPRYAAAADRIGRALRERAWLADAGQLARGVGEDGLDRGLALDCASWGALFLAAQGDRLRAETAFAVADARYGVQLAGHRPYAHAPVYATEPLRRLFGPRLPSTSWDTLDVVWPEGSAGVALAALRLGRRERARAILDALERLRDPAGALPTATLEVPLELSAGPGVAGTAWALLVRAELDGARPLLWVD